MLQGTKLGDEKFRLGKRWLSPLNSSVFWVPAKGVAGGLLTCSDSSSISVDEILKGGVLSIPEQVIIGNMYCSNFESERGVFLNSAEGILISKESLLFLGGDFNGTLILGERIGGEENVDTSLCNLMENMGFIDLPLASGEFTWFSSRNGGLWIRFEYYLNSSVGLLEHK